MPDEPKHALSALTTYELRDYRRELERAIKGISADAPVQHYSSAFAERS
jgi:hypothetical protein